MSYSHEGVLHYIEEHDVKFVRLVFCDIFGVPKNVAIMADQLPQVFEHGASFDVSAVDGFMNIEESDLLLFPDPSSLAVLPWRPSTGRVVRMYCDIRHPDGRPFVGDGRHLLRQACREAAAQGLSFRVGTECEFYLFELDADGKPTLRPQDSAGYLDMAPLDKGENVRRDICLALEEMGLYPKGSHHEKGPGQNEIWCSSTDALRAADDFITYKSVVRTIAAQYGLFACFMPKPLANASGSGLHINLSLYHDNKSIFGEDSIQGNSFIAGLLDKVGEITLFLNPTTNSYNRFGNLNAPKYISWSKGNRSQLLRVPASDTGKVELRSPDPLCNPYLAFTLLLKAGLSGVAEGLPLPPSTDFDLARASIELLQGCRMLPATLGEAVNAANESAFVHRALPAEIVQKTVSSKQLEWEEYLMAASKDAFDHSRYFALT